MRETRDGFFRGQHRTCDQLKNGTTGAVFTIQSTDWEIDRRQAQSQDRAAMSRKCKGSRPVVELLTL